MMKRRLQVTLTSLLAILLARSADAQSPLFYEPFEGLSTIQANGGRSGRHGWPEFSSGVAGSAADFSGSKTVCYPLAGNFSLSSGTVDFWIKPPNQNHLGFFDINSLGRSNSWGVFKNVNHVIMEVKNQSNRFDQAWSPHPIGHDSDWHLVTAVWERSGTRTQFKVCWDGQCKASYDGITDDSHPNLSGEFCIGWSGWYGPSESTIDELRIWDYAKSDAEISSDFFSTGPDKVRPVITMNGSRTMVLEIGATYDELGASAADDRDGDLTQDIVTHGSPETTRAGAYRITYNVADAAGNHAREAIRMVYVLDLSVSPAQRAFRYLAERMDQFNVRFDVYSDFVAGGNHGIPSGWMGDYEILMVDPSWDANCFQGLSCFKNIWETNEPGWVGIRWLQPEDNWGTVPGAGHDLSGATKVSFHARGAVGNEAVEFVAGGIPGDYPDSIQPFATTGTVLLSTEWQYYEIDLSGLDLSHVISPFGWVVRNDPIFFIDEIAYDLPRPDALRLIQSFEIQDQEAEVALANVAYVYDNALALSAFLARGMEDDVRRARIIADTLVFVLENDRFYADGRIRNGYSSGDISDPVPVMAKLPGWWDRLAEAWYENEFNVSTHTGNVAWAMLALLSYYESEGGSKYLAAAERMGDWVAETTWDDRGDGGFMGGFAGWEPSPANPDSPTRLLYKATEHNIDLYPAFLRLYSLTRKAKWLARAEHAKRFVDSMWNPSEGHFWTGTGEDGMDVNMSNVPVDVQTWAVMAMPGETRYHPALNWSDENCTAESDGFTGFDFNCGDGDGVWFEGTAQMVIGFDIIGEDARASTYLAELRKAQTDAQGADGSAIVAASHDGVTTGFDWEYFARKHVGATSWYLLAERSSNPYWGSRTRAVPVIKVDGTVQNVTSSSDGLSLDLDLVATTARGEAADWWLVMFAPGGEWFYYDRLGAWNGVGSDLSAISPAMQAPLADLRGVRVAPPPELRPGSYTFYFAVDLVADGKLTLNRIYYDLIKVDIK